jgi:3-(3-hydroxy-phenyl)propionate hydroxylase
MEIEQSANIPVSVLIVGAGPTGLVAANLLGLYGIKTLLIERNPALSTFPRAISIDDEGLRICQALGSGPEVLRHVRLNVGAEYRSRDRVLVHVAPQQQRNGYPLISTFDQPALEATLLAGLQRFPCVEVCFEQTLEQLVQTEQGVLASVRHATGKLQQVACAYVLACDGGKSSIRRSLGIVLRGTTFFQRWLVVDAICKEQPPADYITFFCNPTRPAVSVPAPGDGWRWEFMLLPGEAEDWFLAPASLLQLLQQIGDTRQPHVQRQSIYTFHASRASAFRAGRVFLLGDAAHLLPPFGGQGMNCGLRDAHNLTWKIAFVLNRQADPAILATYQQERAPHALEMLRLSSFLGKIVMPTSLVLVSVRDSLLRLLMTLPPVAAALTEMRIKPDSAYRRGLRLSDGSRLSAGFAGKLLPQPVVVTQGGLQVQLDELLGSGFALLRFSSNPVEAFTSLQSDLWQKLKPRFICLLPAAAEPLPLPSQHVTYARDNSKQFEHFLRGNRNLFVLVRPDRYICGAFHTEREESFARALQKQIFGSKGGESHAD